MAKGCMAGTLTPCCRCLCRFSLLFFSESANRTTRLEDTPSFSILYPDIADMAALALSLVENLTNPQHLLTPSAPRRIFNSSMVPNCSNTACRSGSWASGLNKEPFLVHRSKYVVTKRCMSGNAHSYETWSHLLLGSMPMKSLCSNFSNSPSANLT